MQYRKMRAETHDKQEMCWSKPLQKKITSQARCFLFVCYSFEDSFAGYTHIFRNNFDLKIVKHPIGTRAQKRM